MNLEHLAVYLKYVLRPSRVIHLSTDHGRFVQQCEKIGLPALAIDCNKTDEAVTSNVIYRNWVEIPLNVDDLDLNNTEPTVLVLVTDIPKDTLYFCAPNILHNITLFPAAKVWLTDSNLDRWIYDLGYRSYIVDVDSTVHAAVSDFPMTAIFKSSFS